MKAREYERRRRALEAQLHADLDLIRAGYEAKLRALEMLWLASAPNETVPDETVSDETVQSETVPAETVRGGGQEIPRGALLNDLLGVLPGLPELFEKKDIYQALGYVPSRASLYRAIRSLQEGRRITIARYSDGGKRTQYRKLR